MAIGRTIIGTDNQEVLNGTAFDDIIFARGGEDIVSGRAGNDRLNGEADADIMFGGSGNDRMIGGTGNDNVWGDDGNDVLFGDSGRQTAKRSDLGIDRLDGGRGNDTLFQSDGDDFLTGGADADRFYFKWQDPMNGDGRAFATLTDFNAAQDKLLFDVAGVSARTSTAPTSSTAAPATDARRSGGQLLQGRRRQLQRPVRDGADRPGLRHRRRRRGGRPATRRRGDFVMYFNTSVGVASLLFVDGADAAHSIARFTDINSLADLQGRPARRRRLPLRLIHGRPHCRPAPAGRLARVRKTVTKAGVPCILAAAAGPGGVAGGQKWKALPRSS